MPYQQRAQSLRQHLARSRQRLVGRVGGEVFFDLMHEANRCHTRVRLGRALSGLGLDSRVA